MTDWKVLVCEDNYLLATDLAMELEARGAAVYGITGRVSGALAMIRRPDFDANAAVLDIELADGASFELVEPLQRQGIVTVFCTGYGLTDLPPQYAGLPCVTKPTTADDVLFALKTHKQEQRQVEDDRARF